MLDRIRAWLRGSKALAPPPATTSFPFLQAYSGQTTAELIGLEPTHRVDSIVLAFEMGIEQKGARLGLDSLSGPERVVLAVEAVEREVNSDEFDGLFRNASKEHATNFVGSLEAIGRSDVAALVARAIAALRLGKQPLSVAAIDGVLDRDSERRDEALDNLSSEYYEVAGDLAPDLFAYIRASAAEIALP